MKFFVSVMSISIAYGALHACLPFSRSQKDRATQVYNAIRKKDSAKIERYKQQFTDYYRENRTNKVLWDALKIALWTDDFALLQDVLLYVDCNSKHPVTRKSILLIAVEVACLRYKRRHVVIEEIPECLKHLLTVCDSKNTAYRLPSVISNADKYMQDTLDSRFDYAWYSENKYREQYVGLHEYALNRGCEEIAKALLVAEVPVFKALVLRNSVRIPCFGSAEPAPIEAVDDTTGSV